MRASAGRLRQLCSTFAPANFSADVRVIVSAIPWDVVCERPRLADLPTGKPLVVYCAFAGPVFASATAAGARR
jgi:hypothetical protein